MKPTLLFGNRTQPAEAFFGRWQRSASALVALGVGEGDVVALLLPNGPGFVELNLALRWIGARWCPINWHFTADEVAYILGDSGARWLIGDAALLAALGDALPPGITVLTAEVDDGEGPAEPGSWRAWRDSEPRPPAPERPVRGAMLYTSGTTGRPKGIRRDASSPAHAARSREVTRQVLGLVPGMRALIAAPLYHSAPNSYVIGVAQESGTLVVEARFDAERTLQLIERHRISHAYLVPTMYVRLLRLPDAVRARYDVSSLRFVASTGSPCPPEVKRAMIDWFGPVIHEAYGSSEIGYMTLLNPLDALRKPGSAGQPLPGVELRISGDDGELLPSGESGLIYARQPTFADFSYTSDKNGNQDGRKAMEKDGFLTMGDIGFLDDDGFLFIVDRAANMVISGGVNIYPAEIEAVLQAMPGVADCAVFGIPDAEFGETLAAAVQPETGATLGAAAVLAHLSTQLARYKLPRVITFHSELPREDTGKIFKRKLREPYWQDATRRI